MRKVIAPLLRKKYKSTTITENDILIRFCQWVHVENRERRVIDGEKHSLNAGNLTDCADIIISDDVTDISISTAIDVDNLTDCDDDAAGVLISAVDAGD